MNDTRHRRSLGDLLVLVALMAIAARLYDVMISPTRWPGACMPIEPPYERIIYWCTSQNGTGLFEHFNRAELVELITLASSFGACLAILFCPCVRRGIGRRLMLALVVLMAVGNVADPLYQRRTHYLRMAEFHAEDEQFERIEGSRCDPSDHDLAELCRRMVSWHREMKEMFQEAATRPWQDVEESPPPLFYDE
jgi:hypothetical protein